VVIFLIGFIPWMGVKECNAQQSKFNDDFPRLANYYFAGFYVSRSVIERLVKWDIIIGLRVSRDIIEAIRQLRPDIKLILYEKAFQVTNTDGPYGHPEWYLKDSKGNIISPWTGQYCANISSYCPEIDGEKWYDRHPKARWRSKWSQGLFDGIMYDYYYTSFTWIGDVDFDNNGRNDLDEHGGEWVNRTLAEGLETLARNTRNLVGDDFIIIGNSATTLSHSRGILNGHMIEAFPDYSFYFQGPGENSCVNDYDLWMSERGGKEPRLFIINGGTVNTKGERNDFRNMRQALTWCLMNDGYFSYDGGPAGHHNLWWYDEYETNLGYPKGPYQVLDNGVWVRFFDNGVVLFNPTEQEQEVTDNDLRKLDGYDGPYYKFRGGQDPEWNNGDGTPVQSLRIYSAPSRTPDKYDRQGRKLNFDGYILLKEFRTIVTDIVIDDAFYSTSPGQEEAQLEGNWIKDRQLDLSNPLDRTFYGNNHDDGYWYSEAGSGENTCVWRPKINVPGQYEVFVWYPQVERRWASNAPYTVVSAEGTQIIRVDQNRNGGRWYSLGVFRFEQGRRGFVKLTNQANGPVKADAVKFVFLDGRPKPQDKEPPQAPRNVRIRIE